MATRRESLGLIGAALLLPSCGARAANAVRVGSMNSSENTTIAQIYALALERQQILVERRMGLGDAQAAMTALRRGEIDLYPGYEPAQGDEATTADEPRTGITWLTPSPASDSACLATSQYAAEKYWLLTLATCARIAPQLRLAATPDFSSRNGLLRGLQRTYGGFGFKSIRTFPPGEQYDALGRGDADVASAFTTAPEIAERQLIVLADEKHFWPQRHIAPAVRIAVLQAHPRIRAVLNRVSGLLTQYAVQRLNMNLNLLSMEPRDAAEYFLHPAHP